MTDLPILSLRTGRLAPLGPRGLPSGIDKQAVFEPLMLSKNGFAGDHQGDTAKHGGPEKAVHHYPFDHYPVWAETMGDHPRLSAAGAFGENISTSGLTEVDVAIGDVFRLGKAVVEVSQGRQPCWRLNERFQRKTMAREVQDSGRTGWYYRIIESGMVGPGDRLTLVERKAREWTIARIWRAFYIDRLDQAELRCIAALEPLAESWRNHAARRLDSGRVEDWSKRLQGPAAEQ